jgi:hypothetical protein
MDRYKWLAAASATVALISVVAVAGTVSPVAYGAGELTGAGQVGIGIGSLTAIGSVISFIVSLFKSGGQTLVADATELLGPIVKGESSVAQSAVRVSLFILQIDRAQRGDAEGLKMVQDLSARILIAPKESERR